MKGVMKLVWEFCRLFIHYAFLSHSLLFFLLNFFLLNGFFSLSL